MLIRKPTVADLKTRPDQFVALIAQLVDEVNALKKKVDSL